MTRDSILQKIVFSESSMSVFEVIKRGIKTLYRKWIKSRLGLDETILETFRDPQFVTNHLSELLYLFSKQYSFIVSNCR
jgi:hypothetical protein